MNPSPHNWSFCIPARAFSALAFAAVLLVPVLAPAQVPNTLRHAIPAPPVGSQPGTQAGAGHGFSVAVDGGLIVAGSPFDNI